MASSRGTAQPATPADESGLRDLRLGRTIAEDRGTRATGAWEIDDEERAAGLLLIRAPDGRRAGSGAEIPPDRAGRRDTLVDRFTRGRRAVPDDLRGAILDLPIVFGRRDPVVLRLITPREELRPGPRRVFETRGEGRVLDGRLTLAEDDDRDLPGRERAVVLRGRDRVDLLRALERPRVAPERERCAEDRLEEPRDFDLPAVLRALLRRGGPAADSLAPAKTKPAANTIASNVLILVRALMAYPPVNTPFTQKFSQKKTSTSSIVLIC